MRLRVRGGGDNNGGRMVFCWGGGKAGTPLLVGGVLGSPRFFGGGLDGTGCYGGLAGEVQSLSGQTTTGM